MKKSPFSQSTRTDAGLAAVLRVVVGRLARRLRAQRLDTSLSLGQGAALYTLARHGEMTPGELAEHEKVQPPSMTRIVAALEERGLVRRAKHPGDQRRQLVDLTDAGRELVRADQRQREAWLAQRLQELTPEERDTLRRAAEILDRLSQS
ncbi:MarR family transcriptional regulator [Streptomonospora sp. S1-112]|uniref:DNA-binding MarR family transcriptional regulator n=2 Tax=Streptomonospora TaxID=104204 RepID=A0A853BQ92_9ACTN|nr:MULTISPECIES: MarR family transcriptional regulator [Streptomonospora]MBV2363934.1 MarR family transcriptional regulator [Streptomonospora nanhaiensis]MBX9388400.1 MarR family transcriptional regulator [Streptomonospora nanhaiensis]MDA0566638.1 MarR family transcriptional regulator [Streptomonospora mangrovi]NYI96757.1 DNA-binding MarR family transcriptional regulator [Streptomonospora nanhaiensis]